MKNTSTLLVYGNEFSCKLPHHYGVRPTSAASLSLIGNHFAKPRRVPTWIGGRAGPHKDLASPPYAAP
eukprot:6099133-Amphidinium_carterae.1